MNDPDWALNQVGYRQLAVFCAVVEAGNFSAAARQLDLNQSTVSRHVNKLEELFDTALLFRDSGIHQVTDFGRVVYENACKLRAVRENFDRSVLNFFDELEEEITVGASTIPGEIILPRMLARFRQQHADLEAELLIDDSKTVIEKISAGELRFGVVGLEPGESGLESEVLFRDEMVLVSSEPQDHEPLDASDLADLPYVGRGEGSGTQQAVQNHLRERLGDTFQGLNVVVNMDTTQAVHQGILEGLGVSYLPLRLVRGDLGSGDLTVLETPWGGIERTFYGVRNSFLGLPPLTQQFNQFLSDHGLGEVDRGIG